MLHQIDIPLAASKDRSLLRCTLLCGCVFLFSAITVSHAQISIGGTTTMTGDAISTSFNHTVENESNRILFVTVVHEDADDGVVQNVTFGGQALTLIGDIASGSNSTDDPRVSAYHLVNPPVGTHTLTLGWADDGAFSVGVFALWNVDTQNPIYSSSTNWGESSSPNSVISTLEGRLVIDVFGHSEDFDSGASAQLDQQQLWLLGGDGDGELHGVSSRFATSDGDITMGWNTDSGKWGHIVWAVNPIPEPGTYALVFGVVAIIGATLRRRFGQTGK